MLNSMRTCKKCRHTFKSDGQYSWRSLFCQPCGDTDLDQWSWEANRGERVAGGYDMINSVAYELGLKKCIPRSQYPKGFPPGYYSGKKPGPYNVWSAIQADSGYPAINPK
jgi:hypothetical protein